MVKLEEVPDEDFTFQQQGPKVEEEDDWDTDSGTFLASPISSHPIFRAHRIAINSFRKCQKAPPKLTHPPLFRIRSKRRLRRRLRRVLLGPPRRARRHRAPDLPQAPLLRRHLDLRLDRLGPQLQRQGPLGHQHQRPPARHPMGAGLQRGAADAGDGARDAHAAGRQRGPDGWRPGRCRW